MSDIKREVSAGGIVFKKEGNTISWLICKHSGYHKWALPKGHIEPGETAEAAALREVAEETGITARILAPIIPLEQYTFTLHGEKISKDVHYFLMEYVSGSIEDHDWETEEVAWLPYEQALEHLAFPGAKRALETANQLFAVSK